jgi:hypothetical protein
MAGDATEPAHNWITAVDRPVIVAEAAKATAMQVAGLVAEETRKWHE